MSGSQRRIQTGVLGGSFNPVHAGHLMLASYLAQFTDLDEVWLMLSPANPLKVRTDDVTDSQRLAMLRIACEGHRGVSECDVELSMPRPSYSIDSLSRLSELHPDRDFRLTVGSDNWLIFDRWRAYEEIIRRFRPIIYPRPGYPVDASTLPAGVTMVNAPVADVSSTFIRSAIAEGKDMGAFLPAGVAGYIKENGLYCADGTL